MTRSGGLRSRLLVGLIAVTGTGLLLTCVVGFLTLRSFITDRIDAQLQLTAERATVRLDNDTPPVGVDAPSPSPYFVVLLNNRTGAIDQVYGDTEREDVVLDRIRAIPLDQWREYGSTGAIFELDGVDDSVAPYRATVRLRPDTILVTGVPTSDREEYPWRLVLTQLVTAGLLLGGLLMAGRWLIGRGLEPLDEMATTANRISVGTDMTVRMPGSGSHSEVGRLAGAINTMLRRIDDAFAAQRASEERVRAFAADASHELRTPLTTIRGYAELYRQGAIPAEELPGAMRRIENEAERMSRLVAELLELARLDRTGALQRGPTDIAAVTAEVVADARALEPGRPLTLAAPEALTCDADEARVRQILANLLANVREHTPEGTAAAVRLREEGGTAVLEVADEGPGMAPADLRRAFDRFYRGTRAPNSGSGLGLSIVKAIAEAHGGGVELASAPGEGTTVTVRIPRRRGG
ncbi:sensor histidine kinase [Streptomonospora nanhaiensis]|uniref:histidine kinase n=1 Tax=Streptomonospora nanhaiensis TaxID=1323731 RepID=A0A853BS25_9ACTN|nr:HAMP domain-containing sensor histidine kinase [Streptomonospora nanhaiensis]MBV2364963.1 HAMP domain-containing histidine kinase [Streptomonospora nanhaiensis]MBX9389795.1 HAMP domain-containing histidine kinase [Streptomonospora nanhaiensis]NYI97516.1 two-component system OmpR family sensor kinase [Streptomonospora nanhaiensis]